MDTIPSQSTQKPTPFRDFANFIREQGVVGLAVGFILGGAVSKVVASFVNDIVNPFLAVFLGAKEGLLDLGVTIAGQKILVGSFVSTVVDFVVIAFVVYFGVRLIGIQRFDRKKES